MCNGQPKLVGCSVVVSSLFGVVPTFVISFGIVIQTYVAFRILQSRYLNIFSYRVLAVICMFLPCGAMGCSVICDYGISWSYRPVLYYIRLKR